MARLQSRNTKKYPWMGIVLGVLCLFGLILLLKYGGTNTTSAGSEAEEVDTHVMPVLDNRMFQGTPVIWDKQRTWKEKKRAKRVYKKNKKRNKRGEYDPPEQVEVIPLEIIEPNYPGPYAYVDDAYTPIPPLPYEEERYEAESYEVASVPLSLSNQQCSAACEKKDFECQFALMCEVENECRESNPRSRADPVCQDCKALQQAQEKKEQIPFACNICASSVEDCRVCRKLDNGGVC